jgi:diaminohydroxyphosphoribosylaminopyrimidine deaminase / 5-amino-6-(5-phosphoribosylamino)uracil reductase
MVGAVIVRDGRIVGEGYHELYGGPHAEVNAARRAGGDMAGATVYVNLEPCAHFGKTPPCADLLVAARPARVVIGTADPNPLVAGKGIEALQAHGIAVTAGVMEERCRELNERFFKFMATHTPYVTLKFAETLDGKIATANGDSRWISSPASRKFAHALRSIHDGILVGVGTVLQDDPELTCRLVRGRNPVRIVVDSRLRVPLEARLVRDARAARTIVAHTPQASRDKEARLTEAGIETLAVAADGQGRVDMTALLAALGAQGLHSILVEGGGNVIASLLASRLADRIVAIVAPKIVGSGKEAVGALGVERMDDALPVTVRCVTRKGGDIIVDGRIGGGSRRFGGPP